MAAYDDFDDTDDEDEAGDNGGGNDFDDTDSEDELPGLNDTHPAQPRAGRLPAGGHRGPLAHLELMSDAEDNNEDPPTPTFSRSSDDDYDTDDQLRRRAARAAKHRKMLQQQQQQRQQPPPQQAPPPQQQQQREQEQPKAAESGGAGGSSGGQGSDEAVDTLFGSRQQSTFLQDQGRAESDRSLSSSCEETGFRTGMQPSLRGGRLRGLGGFGSNRRIFGAAAAAASEAEDDSNDTDESSAGPTALRPSFIGSRQPSVSLPLAARPPSTSRVWLRLDEFDRIQPEVVYCAPLSSMPFPLRPYADEPCEQLLLYKTHKTALGKVLVTEEPNSHLLRVKWCTYNTLLVGITEPYSAGTALIDPLDVSKCTFNLSFGGHASLDKEQWGSLLADVAFNFKEVDGKKALHVQPMNGAQFHDYNPFGCESRLAELVTTLVGDRGSTRTLADFKWQPPHVLTMSDEGIDQIQYQLSEMQDSHRSGGLQRAQLDEVLTKWFGAEVLENMVEEMLATFEDDEEEQQFRHLCCNALRFSQSSYVRDGVWRLLSHGAELAPYTGLIQLIDAVVVAEDFNVVSEFLIQLLFNNKKQVSLDDLRNFMSSVLDPHDATACLDDPHIQSLFMGKRKASISEMRYSINFINDAVIGIQFFLQIISELSNRYGWEKEL